MNFLPEHQQCFGVQGECEHPAWSACFQFQSTFISADCSWKSPAFLFSMSESMRFHETKINGQFRSLSFKSRIEEDGSSRMLLSRFQKDFLQNLRRMHFQLRLVPKLHRRATGTSRTCDPCHPFEVHAKAFPCQGARHFLIACLDPSVAQRLHFLITIYQRPTRGLPLPTVLPDFQGKNLYAIDFGCGFMRCTATAVPAWWS